MSCFASTATTQPHFYCFPFTATTTTIKFLPVFLLHLHIIYPTLTLYWPYIAPHINPTSTLHRSNNEKRRRRRGKITESNRINHFSSQLGVLMIKSRRVFGTFYSQLVVSYFKPTDITCVMKPWLQHIGFSLVYGPLALKTWRYCKKNLFINIRFLNLDFS